MTRPVELSLAKPMRPYFDRALHLRMTEESDRQFRWQTYEANI
jgi:hypothetical protein